MEKGQIAGFRLPVAACERPTLGFSCEYSTFTFTLIGHLGETHSHRSRGDPSWGAQSAAHTHMDTHSRAAHEHRHRIDQKEERGGSVKVVREEAKEGQLTFTDLARANV